VFSIECVLYMFSLCRADLPNTSAATGVEGNEDEVGPALEHLLSVCALQGNIYTADQHQLNTSNLPLYWPYREDI
jgi:hypothetical protein